MGVPLEIMFLHEKISSLRKSKGISQELLAENSHVSLRTIQRIESGASIPRPYTLKVIADALGVPLEQVSSIHSNRSDGNVAIEGLAKLRLINLAALAAFILPLANIILPLIIWKRNKDLPLVNAIGRKIISFQILWTAGTLLVLVSARLLQVALTGSVAIGHFPPTLVSIYFLLLLVNFLFIISAAVRLRKGASGIYSFVPALL